MSLEQEMSVTDTGASRDKLDDTANPGQEMLAHAAEAANFLKVIANPHRLLILCALAGNRREMSVSELEKMLDLRQPTLSQQLARLRQDGIVATRRDGKSIHYRLQNNRASIVVMLLYEWFCDSNQPQ